MIQNLYTNFESKKENTDVEIFILVNLANTGK